MQPVWIVPCPLIIWILHNSEQKKEIKTAQADMSGIS